MFTAHDDGSITYEGDVDQLGLDAEPTGYYSSVTDPWGLDALF